MLNFRQAARNSVMSQRFFSLKTPSPKVQFMHIIADPQYRLGLLGHAETQYPGINFNPDVLGYNNQAKSIMEIQAKRVAASMMHILQLASANRGVYEKRTR